MCLDKHDFNFWKGRRFIKEDSDFERSKQIIKEHMPLIMQLYANLQGESTSYPGITSQTIGDFCKKSKLMDKDFNLSTSDRLYIASTVKIAGEGEEPPKPILTRGSNQSPDSMVATSDMLRYEFIELLVRIAKAKYIDTNLHERYYNALDVLFEVDLVDYTRSMHSTTGWRHNELYTLEITDCLFANLEGLKLVYKAMCIKPRKQMNYSDSMRFMTSYDLTQHSKRPFDRQMTEEPGILASRSPSP